MKIIGVRFNLILNLLTISILIAISPLIPGVTWFRLGDFTLDVVNYYHVIMLIVAYSLIMATFELLKLGERITKLVAGMNIPFLVLDLLGLATFYYPSLLGLNAWVQALRDVIALIFALILGIRLLQYPFIKKDEFRLTFGAISLLILSVWSSIIAGTLGMIYEFGTLYGFASLGPISSYFNSIGGPGVVLPNLLTSHSHEMLPAVMGGIVGISAIAFGYSKLEKRMLNFANIAMIISAVGVISMTVIYVLSSLWTYTIPTLFSFGPGDMNGLALDDSQTGIVGWGAILLVIPLLFLKGEGNFRRARNLELLTWIGAMTSMIGIGYVIEFNESFYGFGSPGVPPSGGPGYMYDLSFTDGHLILTFFILVIFASLIYIIYMLKGQDIKIDKVSYYLGLTGIFLGVEGLLVYTMTTFWYVEAFAIILLVLDMFLIIFENGLRVVFT